MSLNILVMLFSEMMNPQRRTQRESLKENITGAFFNLATPKRCCGAVVHQASAILGFQNHLRCQTTRLECRHSRVGGCRLRSEKELSSWTILTFCSGIDMYVSKSRNPLPFRYLFFFADEVNAFIHCADICSYIILYDLHKSE